LTHRLCLFGNVRKTNGFNNISMLSLSLSLYLALSLCLSFSLSPSLSFLSLVCGVVVRVRGVGSGFSSDAWRCGGFLFLDNFCRNISCRWRPYHDGMRRFPSDLGAYPPWSRIPRRGGGPPKIDLRVLAALGNLQNQNKTDK
jgi:hypothetical protein